MNPYFSILTILVLLQIPLYLCQNDQQYETCIRPFNCSGITEISYPFWGGDRPPSCGHPDFELNCQGNNPLLHISSTPYRVLDIDNSTQTLRIAREDLWDTICPTVLFEAPLDFTLFRYSSTSNDQNITLQYGCTMDQVQPITPPYQFSCDVNGTSSSSFYLTREASLSGLGNGIRCNRTITVPVNQTAARELTFSTVGSRGLLQDALRAGFSIQWSEDNENCVNCERSGGVCGYSEETVSFACYCADGPYDLTCNNTSTGNNGNNRTDLGRNIGLFIAGAVLVGVGLGWLIFYCKQRRKRLAAKSTQTLGKEITPTSSTKPLSSVPSTAFTAIIPSYPSSNSDLGRGSTYFGVRVFNYTELEEATNNFDSSRELGDGGFGTVYYGVLPDGRIVAVKRLYENNFKRVEQFMNEVEILTRLRHQNLVTLFGCTSKRSRELLLVYEYIPNGTIADHLHGKRAKSGLLSWPIRLNIAIETAEALSYLHKSDIIHRDVKSNNILLDNDFHVKVADFGLSRLFPNDVTHVSTAPQGTPGYVDPEYYQCYQLTEKSDVYSFGVVLIELISSLQAVDTNRVRHDINLANMAVNKIQNHTLHELVDSSIGFETNSVVRRMVTLVAELGFRCLQQERDMRPSMEEVLEGLRGIEKEDLNCHKVEIMDILVDGDAWASESTPNSSG